MLKTTGARLQQVRRQLGLSQQQLAELFGLKGNAAVSYMESRDTALPKQYLSALQERYGVSPSYLQMGEGAMFLAGHEVAEKDVVYDGNPNNLSLTAVRARFQEQVNDYLVKHNLDSRKELAERWKINVSHLNGVMSDLRDVTLPMLLKGQVHGKLNLNYTASGEGGFYVGDGDAVLVKRVKELELVVEVLKENVSLREGVPKKRHSG